MSLISAPQDQFLGCLSDSLSCYLKSLFRCNCIRPLTETIQLVFFPKNTSNWEELFWQHSTLTSDILAQLTQLTETWFLFVIKVIRPYNCSKKKCPRSRWIFSIVNLWTWKPQGNRRKAQPSSTWLRSVVRWYRNHSLALIKLKYLIIAYSIVCDLWIILHNAGKQWRSGHKSIKT